MILVIRLDLFRVLSAASFELLPIPSTAVVNSGAIRNLSAVALEISETLT